MNLREKYPDGKIDVNEFGGTYISVDKKNEMTYVFFPICKTTGAFRVWAVYSKKDRYILETYLSKTELIKKLKELMRVGEVYELFVRDSDLKFQLVGEWYLRDEMTKTLKGKRVSTKPVVKRKVAAKRR